MATHAHTTPDTYAEQEAANIAIGNAMIALQDLADELMIVPDMTTAEEAATASLFADALAAGVQRLRDTLEARQRGRQVAYLNRVAPGLGDDMARLPAGLAAVLGKAIPGARAGA